MKKSEVFGLTIERNLDEVSLTIHWRSSKKILLQEERVPKPAKLTKGFLRREVLRKEEETEETMEVKVPGKLLDTMRELEEEARGRRR